MKNFSVFFNSLGHIPSLYTKAG